MKQDLELIRMSDIQPEQVQWLWYPYIPLGKLTVIQGDPGEGKTTFVLAVIAALTKGEALPEREPLDPVNILYQTAEDGLADTIRPRLDALGADGSRVLVIGFGRVGRAAAQRMAALGARVTVAARRYESLAWAQAIGYGAEKTGQLAGWLCGYDLVVNTVPALVLGEAELADLKPDCLVLDLASKPGGVDLEAAARLGRNVIWALSLPGKVAPVTAGAAIKNTIYNMLHELGA